MQPSGVITITTDFGHKGPFVAVMKGVILGRFDDAKIVDLTHEIPAQWPPEAGFWVSRCYHYFPPGTVHLAIVDPGVGTERDILLVEYDQHYFMAPDNGLLARMLDVAEGATVFKLDPDALGGLNIVNPSMTFHGRDIFAPIAAEIAAGRTTPAAIGKASEEWTPAADFKEPIAHIGGHEIPMHSTYARAKPGSYLALINSFGVLEIARAEGNAAEGLGTDRGAPLTVTDGSSTI